MTCAVKLLGHLPSRLMPEINACAVLKLGRISTCVTIAEADQSYERGASCPPFSHDHLTLPRCIIQKDPAEFQSVICVMSQGLTLQPDDLQGLLKSHHAVYGLISMECNRRDAGSISETLCLSVHHLCGRDDVPPLPPLHLPRR